MRRPFTACGGGMRSMVAAVNAAKQVAVEAAEATARAHAEAMPRLPSEMQHGG